MPRLPRALPIAALFLVSGTVYSARLARPYETDAEAALAMYASFARNYLKFGYSRSGGAPLDAAGPALEAYPTVAGQIYAHRPPVVSLLVSLPYQVFGSREPVLRATLVLAALGTLAVFLQLAVRVMGPGWGLAAAALFALAPIYGYYSVTTVHQVFGLLGALLVYLFYLRWRESPAGARLWALLGISFGACWLDWPAYFAVGAVALLHFARGERRAQAFLLLAPAVAAFGAFVLYLYLLDPAKGIPLASLLASGKGHSAGPPGFLEYLASEARELAIQFTIPLLALAGLGAARLRPRGSFPDAVVLSLALLGSDEVLFPSMCAWHTYLTFPLAPWAALAGAGGLRFLWGRPWGRAAAALLAAAFLLQAGAVLARRWSFVGSYEVHRGAAETLDRHTAPGDRILLRLNHDPYLRTYYADRYVVSYSDRDRELRRQYVNPLERGVYDAELIRRLSSPGHGFTWFVTSTSDLAAARFAWIRALRGRPDFEAIVRRHFFLETPGAPTELFRFLRERFPCEEREGFLFFDLRPR